ncbi:AraC family transcriptional regulator [Paenibacillus hamazuiensis]|uniref:AraC family transcriptional regulator n=1 Tax=Paenibacillus hamazuiensis TaxID=2936508 RepID=UPI00200EAEDE|nr:AraC family transcriptional regulator [Paenibacillus hamazuiensis]
MIRLKRWNISRALTKMILYMTLTMLLMVTLLSKILYDKFEQIGLKNAYEVNQKLLAQLAYNLDYMNETVRSISITQYFTPGNTLLMQAKDMDTFDKIKSVNAFHNIIVNNPLLHSAILYNHRTGDYHFIDSAEDRELMARFKENGDLPILKPIPRILNQEPVFTYFMYEKGDKDIFDNGALVLNVKMDWLRNELNKFINDDTNYMIVNNQGQVIIDAKNKFQPFETVRWQDFQGLNEARQSDSHMFAYTNNERRLVSFLDIPGTEWAFISDTPSDSVFHFILEVKRQTMLCAVLGMFFAVLVSVALSRIFYSPMGNLVKKVKSVAGEMGDAKDEADYIEKAFRISIDRYTAYKTSTQDLMKENAIKSLLMDSHSASAAGIESLRELSDFFRPGRFYFLVLLTFDQLKHYERMSTAEKQLVKFTVLNIAGEVFGEWEACEKTYLGDGEFVYLLGTNSPDIDSQMKTLHQNIRIFQSLFNRVHKSITMSAMIAKPSEENIKLPDLYKEAQRLRQYRLSFGSACVIESGAVLPQAAEPLYPANMEKKLVEAVKAKNPEGMKDAYVQFIAALGRCDEHRLMLSLLQLSLAIGQTLHETNRNRFEKMSVDPGRFQSDILQSDTLEEMEIQFFQLFEKIAAHSSQPIEMKHQVIVQSVIDYIHLHLADEDLSPKAIAAEFKLSVGHLGDLFKQVVETSISKYIFDLRMEKVKYLLRTTDKSVKEVAASAGLYNEANFYKAFKKEFGVTPNEYRLHTAVEGVKGSYPEKARKSGEMTV